MKDPKGGVTRARPLTRSELMSRVRGKHSSAERALRSALHTEGLRFCPHRRVESVAADIVFPGPRVAVFVDGCFWHGCPKHATFPKTNQKYWLPKLAENRERDRRQSVKIRAAGWRVFRLWQHDCQPVADRAVKRIVQVCRSRSAPETL